MKKFAVLGSCISYTMSPFIHNEVFKALGVDASYLVEDIPADGLEKNIDRLLSSYDGFNVTMPFKKDILKYITSNEPAVNTVLCKSKTGYNTDGFGFMRDVTRLTGGGFDGMDVLILGAGGAAEIVARELAAAGAKLMIINRDEKKAAALASRYGGVAGSPRPPELIVNCTPIGWDRISNPLPQSVSLEKLNYAYDLIYPPWVSRFLAYTRLVGAKIANGWGMLIYQAIKADKLFLGIDIDYDNAFQAVSAAVEAKNAEEESK